MNGEREGREKKPNVPQCQRLLTLQRYRGGSLYAALPLAYAKRLFPDLNP